MKYKYLETFSPHISKMWKTNKQSFGKCCVFCIKWLLFILKEVQQHFLISRQRWVYDSLLCSTQFNTSGCSEHWTERLCKDKWEKLSEIRFAKLINMLYFCFLLLINLQEFFFLSYCQTTYFINPFQNSLINPSLSPCLTSYLAADISSCYFMRRTGLPG